MNTHFINYFLLAIGIITVLAAVIMIFLDKLKGEDMYFNLDVKEQEIKKVIEDAEELLSELNFTSEVIVKEIEDKMNDLNKAYKSVDYSIEQIAAKSSAAEQQILQNASLQQPKPNAHKTVAPIRFKAKPAEAEEKPKSKRQRIVEMAKDGLSVVEIAKTMDIGQGEVALILSLKNEEN